MRVSIADSRDGATTRVELEGAEAEAFLRCAHGPLGIGKTHELRAPLERLVVTRLVMREEPCLGLILGLEAAHASRNTPVSAPQLRKRQF
jgi:hypothetical protein